MADLNLNDYMSNFKNCLQYEKPYCQAECPFHMDINELMTKIKQGKYNSAYKTYRNAVGFPALVSRICSQPCREVCPMEKYGGAIELSMLEEALTAYATRKDPTRYNIPVRPGKIAVIGSGPAGLGALLRMATKKYETHIFEMSDRIGGSINKAKEAHIFLKDIETQLGHEKYELHLNTEIKTRSELNNMGFDAVFVATGKGGNHFGFPKIGNCNSGKAAESDCDTAQTSQNNMKQGFLDGQTAWFAGGALTGNEGIFALAEGLHMGVVLEGYLKTKKLNYEANETDTHVIIDERKIQSRPSITPTGPQESGSPNIYTKEEAGEEANRCLQCKCDFCRTYEDLTAFYDKWPIRIKDEVFATTLEGSSEVKATPARRLMSTANLTGITKTVCPADIDLDNLILAGRQKMHRLEKAPWVFHDFWLRDMDFANSENASALIKPSSSPISNLLNNSGDSNSDFNDSTMDMNLAFFPGCQLGGSLPEIVDMTYEYLLGKNKAAGLLLCCCGAPALWSGDEAKHEDVLKEIKKQWEEIGSPTLITACPTCTSQLNKYLPEIETVSLYEYLDKAGLPPKARGQATKHVAAQTGKDTEGMQIAKRKEYSVFDPCSTGKDSSIRNAVRQLTADLDLTNSELPHQSQLPRCCSFGGQPAIANPEYAEYVAEKRISEGELPYITYCINCRDSFLSAGKEAVHILELIFGSKQAAVPTPSQRQDNRVLLKQTLLRKYKGEHMEDTRTRYDFKLIIPEGILNEMNALRILKDEVYNVVDFIISTNRKAVDPETAIHSGYRKIGHMTYWVSYKETDAENQYEIIDVYSHRMEIELEAVWNGIKTNIDM